MNLNKMFVFIFVFFVVSTALLTTMPPEFLMLGIDAEYQEKEVVEYFDEHNIIKYNYTLSVNLTYGESQSKEYGLPAGQKLEFWWDYGDYSIYQEDVIELRHTNPGFMGWWTEHHELEVQPPYSDLVTFPGWGLLKEDLLALWDEDYNASYCEFACEHIQVKLFIFSANSSWTLEESWDNHELSLFTSYGIDWTKTGTSMWYVMGQILAFQNPNIGIPGIGGDILTKGFGGALWACIAILFFALVTAVIPTISGWRGD